MRALFLLPLLALTACSGSARESLKGLELPSLGSGKKVSLGQCPAPKCLTVYVAPWCGYCRAATPMINALAKWLQPRGVHTRVVVGMDRPEAVKAYARDFGPDALLDPEGAARPQGGVPSFRITDPEGTVVHSQSGAPGGVQPPWSDELLEQIAALYKLP